MWRILLVMLLLLCVGAHIASYARPECVTWTPIDRPAQSVWLSLIRGHIYVASVKQGPQAPHTTAMRMLNGLADRARENGELETANRLSELADEQLRMARSPRQILMEKDPRSRAALTASYLEWATGWPPHYLDKRLPAAALYVSDFLFLPLWPLEVLLGGVLAWSLVLTRMRATRRRRANQCEACGYDLRGHSGGACPECGVDAHPIELGA